MTQQFVCPCFPHLEVSLNYVKNETFSNTSLTGILTLPFLESCSRSALYDRLGASAYDIAVITAAAAHLLREVRCALSLQILLC
jgi:hypothetical protein